MTIVFVLIVAFLAPRIWDVLAAAFAYARHSFSDKATRRGPDVVRLVPYLE